MSKLENFKNGNITFKVKSVIYELAETFSLTQNFY